MLWHLTTETYGGDTGRAIEGTLPCIRTPTANILVSSLGASKEECLEIAHNIADMHTRDDAARAMLAALKSALEGYISPHDMGPRAIAIRAAIAAAESAGITLETFTTAQALNGVAP